MKINCSVKVGNAKKKVLQGSVLCGALKTCVLYCYWQKDTTTKPSRIIQGLLNFISHLRTQINRYKTRIPKQNKQIN